jgi:hypothetical protein
VEDLKMLRERARARAREGSVCLVRGRAETSVDLSHSIRFVHLFISAHIIIEFVPADFPAVPGKAPVVDTEDTVCNARQCNARETKERKGRNAIADPKVLAKIEWRKEREKRESSSSSMWMSMDSMPSHVSSLLHR